MEGDSIVDLISAGGAGVVGTVLVVIFTKFFPSLFAFLGTRKSKDEKEAEKDERTKKDNAYLLEQTRLLIESINETHKRQSEAQDRQIESLEKRVSRLEETVKFKDEKISELESIIRHDLKNKILIKEERERKVSKK